MKRSPPDSITQKVRRIFGRGMLEGVSVAQRPWFINGLAGAVVEDVHDAKLLDGLLRKSPDDAPFRFVDVAVPVFGPTGARVGVPPKSMMYGVPLLAALGGALSGTALQGEMGAISGLVLGLVSAYGLMRRLSAAASLRALPRALPLLEK